MSDENDVTKMDDPAFLGELRRVRDELERTPAHEISPELRKQFRKLDDEFVRRARAAWQHAR